jgi:hydrogenase maturation protease
MNLMSMKILVAGIGNIFLGDDGFGSAVADQLMRQPQRKGVTVQDFGIRSYDLAYAIMENYDAVILIDAVQRGGPTGTLYLLELDQEAVEQLEGEAVSFRW